MTRTTNVFTHEEPNIKEQVKEVLEQLSIPMSNTPTAFGSLNKEQFDTEINKGISDIKDGRVYSTDSIEEEMKRDFSV